MEAFLTALPTSLVGWIGIVFATVAAGFTAYLIYNKNKDGSDDRLINILKQTVDELEKKVNQQDLDIKGLVLRVQELKTTNETLTKILQGRDETTLHFQAEVLKAVAIANETHASTKEIEKSMGKLTDLISAHMVAMETAKM